MFAKPKEKKLIITIIHANEAQTKSYAEVYQNILINFNKFLNQFIDKNDKLSDKDKLRLKIIIGNQKYICEKLGKNSDIVYDDVSSHRELIGLLVKKSGEYLKQNKIDEDAYSYLETTYQDLSTLEKIISKHCIKTEKSLTDYPNKKAAL